MNVYNTSILYIRYAIPVTAKGNANCHSIPVQICDVTQASYVKWCKQETFLAPYLKLSSVTSHIENYLPKTKCCDVMQLSSVKGWN